jgi:hypothetical protein
MGKASFFSSSSRLLENGYANRGPAGRYQGLTDAGDGAMTDKLDAGFRRAIRVSLVALRSPDGWLK